MLPPNSPQTQTNSNNSSFAKINTNILVALGLAVGKKFEFVGKRRESLLNFNAFVLRLIFC